MCFLCVSQNKEKKDITMETTSGKDIDFDADVTLSCVPFLLLCPTNASDKIHLLFFSLMGVTFVEKEFELLTP